MAASTSVTAAISTSPRGSPIRTPRTPTGAFLLPSRVHFSDRTHPGLALQPRLLTPLPDRMRTPDLPAEHGAHRARRRSINAAAALRQSELRDISDMVSGVMAGKPRGQQGKLHRQQLRSRGRVVDLAEMLSSAAVCEALLQGTLPPADFAATMTGMSREALEPWSASLGACVARLGVTLTELHNHLNRHLRSTKRATMGASAENIGRASGELSATFVDVSQAARDQLSSFTAEHKDLLLTMAEADCAVPCRRSRHWTRALISALASARRQSLALHEATSAVQAASGRLATASQALSDHAARLVGCDEASVYVVVAAASVPEANRLLEGAPADGAQLVRLCSHKPQAEEVRSPPDSRPCPKALPARAPTSTCHPPTSTCHHLPPPTSTHLRLPPPATTHLRRPRLPPLPAPIMHRARPRRAWMCCPMGFARGGGGDGCPRRCCLRRCCLRHRDRAPSNDHACRGHLGRAVQLPY